jgi:hypothetical protein
MLFVTLHGGKPEKNPHKNNVHAYDKNGNLVDPSVLKKRPDVVLDELRGIYLVGKYLYVINANRDLNNVFCYEGADTNYTFVSEFASKATCAGISHPFDMTFDGAGHCFVSSQDTNLVTRLKLSADGRTGTPAAISPALPANGRFCPGTFVASSVGDLNQATTAVPRPAGLEYSADGEKKHSVRGVVWANNALYVADQPARHIKVYDRNGKYLGESNGVESPTHLAVWKGSIYVSGGDEVLTSKLPNPPGNFTLSAIKAVKVKNSSGMAFSDSGHFYVASRTQKKILKFDANFQPMKFDCEELPDDPEFLLHV